MKSGPTSRPSNVSEFHGSRRTVSGFTLVETLAALLFLAIVVPVAVHGIQLASHAGMVSQRKRVAARIAERVLAETTAPTSGSSIGNSGNVREGAIDYRWQARSESWTDSTMRLLTVEVFFDVQGREHEVEVSTLVDPSTR
ncbi:MAG: hypothetical protein AB7O66_15395 [Limisphaerales bacterium]